MADTVRLKYLVTPEWDKTAASKAISDATSLYRQLSKMKVEWGSVSKQASANIGHLKNISTAAQQFGKALSKSANDSFKSLEELGNGLDDLMQQAEGLASQYKAAKTASARKHLSTEIDKVAKKMTGLNKAIEDHQKTYKKQGKELLGITSFVKKFKSEKFDVKGMFDALGAGLKKGGPKGLIEAISGVAGRAGKGVAGAGARSIAAGGGGAGIAGMAKMIPMLAKAAGPIGLVVTALTALWKVLAGASQHMTDLNKELVKGTGTANDFISSQGSYRSTIDELRNASIDAADGLLKYGLKSKDAAAAINTFAVESTGSLTKMHDTMLLIGKGDLSKGIEKFTASALAYGKALGMQTNEVAGMMGKFVSEIGIAEENVLSTMKNIVASAATANIPMTKFMGIFRQVLPDVELYQNRLEELTGTIKLLSRAMSPKDVKQFMDAFAKGFRGVDFKQRLKTVLITGTGYVSKTLEKDFSMKAKTMAKQFGKYVDPGEFEEAFKKGEGAMAQLIAKAKGRAAKEGQQISGTAIGEAMKLAGYEQTRQKGGALNLATALRAAGVFGTYKIMSKMGQSLTKGFDGLSEHVMHQLGISDQQYEALRNTASMLKGQKAVLQMYGKTTSKSLNAGLVQAIAQTKGIKENEVTLDMMKNATEEQLFAAAEYSNQIKAQGDTELTAKDLAEEQVDATMSISEKIDNVLAFILEKIYQVLQPLLDILDGMWSWLVSGKDTKKQAAAIKQNMDRLGENLSKGGTKEANAFYKGVTDAMTKAAMEGDVGAAGQAKAAGAVMEQALGGGQISEYYGKGDKNVEEQRGQEIRAWLKTQGFSEKGSGNAAELAKLQGELITALQNQDWGALGTAVEKVAEKSGRTTSDIMVGFAQDMAKSNMNWSKEWKKGAPGGPMRREVTPEQNTQYLSKSKILKAKKARMEAADVEENMVALSAGAGGKKALGAGGVKTAEQIQETVDEIQKGPVAAGPAAPGGAGQSATKSATKTATAMEESVEATDTQTEAVTKVIDNTNKELSDIAGMLRAGISLDSGYTSGELKKAISDATLESLRTALIEHAILLVKSMKDTSEFGKTFGGGQGEKVAAAGMSALLGMSAGGGAPAWKKLGIVATASDAKFCSDCGADLTKTPVEHGKDCKKKASGGSIAATGPFYLHKGERVLSPAEAAAYDRKGGVGGNTYVMNINGANMSVQDMVSVAKSTFDSMARKS